MDVRTAFKGAAARLLPFSLLFSLLTAAPVAAQVTQNFAIAIGDTVSDGVPGVGAGNIENPNDKDIYTFSAPAGQVIFVDRLQNGIGGVQVQIKDDQDTVVETANFVIDIGIVVLERGGDYTLTVGDDSRSNVGTYSFQLVGVPPPDEFTIAIDDLVADGQPGPGAGNIEVPGASDVYTFDATAGQIIFFDRLQNGIGGVNVRLEDDQQTVVFNSNLIIDIGIFEFERTGTYTLTFGDTFRDNTGTYSFRLVPVAPPDEFEIAIDQVISDGAPGAGAGNIERPGFSDIYTFTASPGQVIFFDRQQNGIGGVRVMLEDEDETVIFNSNLIIDIGIVELELGGIYTLTIGDTFRDNVGTYAFQLWSVPPPDEFEVAIGDTIEDGVPATGAGNIETPGAMDIYRFQAGAGSIVSFDRFQNGIGGVRVRLFDADDTVVFTDNFIIDINDVVLGRGGAYTLEVGDDFRDNVGTYSFAIDLTAPGGPVPPPPGLGAGDQLGAAVAIDGNRLVVGAPGDAGGGAVYVYRFEGDGVVFEEAIPVPDGFVAENFGASLALEGEQLVIGAPQETPARKGEANDMRAAFFQRISGCQSASATCWELKRPIVPDTDDANDGFGTSVALAGGTIVVGAPGDASDEAPGQGSGAAFVFQFDGDNVVQTAHSKPLLGIAGAGFGTSAAATGSAVAVGAPGGQIGAALGGTATLYGLLAGNLGTPQTVSVPGGNPDARFGSSVALAGSTMVVGAPEDGNGLAAVYRLGGGSLVQTQVLSAASGPAIGQFGAAVAVAEGRVLVGAPDGNGAVFRFEDSPSGFREAERTDGEAGVRLGSAVAISTGKAAIGAPAATASAGETLFQLYDDVLFSGDFE